MVKIEKIDIVLLALEIQSELRKEFEFNKISGNLVDSIEIEELPNGVVQLRIPAERYDIREYNKTKVLRFIGKGSYADQVNETGGFSHEHKGYVERCINKALKTWLKTVMKTENYSIMSK